MGHPPTRSPAMAMTSRRGSGCHNRNHVVVATDAISTIRTRSTRSNDCSWCASTLNSASTMSSLLQVRPHHVHEFLRTIAPQTALGVHQVVRDVTLDDLGQQRVNGPSAGGESLEHRGALLLLVQSLLDRVHL